MTEVLLDRGAPSVIASGRREWYQCEDQKRDG